MKILLPTDFSKLSIIPVYYAAKLARKIKAEIILFHAVYVEAMPRASTSFKSGQLMTAMSENALADLEELAIKLKEDVGDDLKVSWHIEVGLPMKEALETFAAADKIDLIIMGTKGASGLKKVLMGSNTAAVISNSKIPIIAVPEFAYFNNIHKIVYASDLQDVENEIEALLPFARLFDASIHLLHIAPPGSESPVSATVLEKALIDNYQYPNITVHILESDNVVEAIDAFIAANGANILAMFTHKPTFFEKLFGQSVTREMAFHSNVALLTMKKGTD
ncbi:MAG: universal stress protein [Saprospiraceae bacterium]